MPDLTRLKRTAIQTQGRVVHSSASASGKGAAVGSFLSLLPNTLQARSLKELVATCIETRRQGLPIVVLYGGHVIKVGLGPLLCDAVRNGLLTALGTNGAGTIHDVELARFGETSEDVLGGLRDGSFGMATETGRDMNLALNAGVACGLGIGAALGTWLNDVAAPNRAESPLATAAACDVPFCVHVAIGTDILHQHPECSGAALGEGSLRDFYRLCDVVGTMQGGGVVLCLGSAVLLPEVLLKALTVARNLDASIGGITTAVFDMNDHYRPRTNVAKRPAEALAGKGYVFIGHHEIMLPLLFHELSLAWSEAGGC